MQRVSVVWAFFLLAVAATSSSAQTVVQTLKIGDNVEGATFVASGKWAGKVLVMDGNDVIAVSLSPSAARRGQGDVLHADHGNHYGLGLLKHERGPASAKAFDVLQLPLEHRTPRGIAYVPTTREFVFSSKQDTPRLFVTDELGNLKRTLVPPVPEPETWSNFEGLVWIPADAPAHGGTIAALGQHTTDFLSHVYFVRLDGTIEGEIIPTPGTPLENYLCGLGYRAGTLYASACDDQIWAMDLDGNVVGDGPALVAAEQTEVIAFDGDGGVHTAGYEAAILRSYDPGLVRRPTLDVDFSVGFGVSVGTLGFKPDTNEILVLTRAFQDLVAVRGDLRAVRVLGSPTAHAEVSPNSLAGPSYLGNDLVAMAHRFFPRGIVGYHPPSDSVTFRSVFFCCTANPDPFPPGPAFAPTGVAPWGPDAFLVSVVGDNDNLKVVTRTGQPLDIFPTALAPTRRPDLPLTAPKNGRGLQVFDAGQGTRILAGHNIYDGRGALVRTIDGAALALTDGLGSVAWLGGDRFVAVDGDTSTLVIFTLR